MYSFILRSNYFNIALTLENSLSKKLPVVDTDL